MNTYLQHFLDRNLGLVLCFFFSLLEKVLRLFRFRKKERPVEKILFVKPVEQGAIILAIPALQRAVAAVGREQVYFFCFEKNRLILDILQIIPRENIITARDEGFFPFAFSMVTALYKLRRLKIDTAVDLEIFARISIILAWLTGARRRVGLSRFNSEGPYRGNLVTHPVQYNPYLHTAQAFEVLVRAAFADPQDAPLLKESVEPHAISLPEFIPTDEDLQEVYTLLHERVPEWTPEQAATCPLVLFNPKCLDELPVRKWPDSSFVEVGQLLRQSHPEIRMLITGLDCEQEACHALATEIGEGALSIAGALSLRGLITLMTLCRALLSSDSGPAHFAALTKLPSVVLFGPETPSLYSPLCSNSTIIYLGLACSPCFSPMNYRLSPCMNNRCMLEISPQQVHDALSQTLAGQETEDKG